MKGTTALLFPHQEGKQPFGRDQNTEVKESLTQALPYSWFVVKLAP